MDRQYPDAWMQTSKGGAFYPFEPDPADADIEDIAHHLSMICRYGGAVKDFYSVAEHSVLVAGKSGLHGLLHDAAEAYIWDLLRPYKRMERFDWYREMEQGVLDAIYTGLNLPRPTVSQRFNVGIADDRMMATEKLVVHLDTRSWGKLAEPYTDVAIECWPPGGKAKQRFLDEYERLCFAEGVLATSRHRGG